MLAPAKQPDADLVRRFLLGQLGEPMHSEVEQLLAESSEWLGAAEAAMANDELLGALRGLGVGEEMPLPAVVAQLIARLERVRPVGTDTQPFEATPPQGGQVPQGWSPAPSAEYPMLSPPRETGELGWLGSYRVLHQLSAGGMGIVFAAEDSLLKRRVALKVMRPEVAAWPDARERFLREAQAAAALDHPNVVPIYQVAETPLPFIAMPLLAGESLADHLRRAPFVPIADMLRIGKEAAQGLAAAHAAGLIHRDIKPGNIWLAEIPPLGGEQKFAAVSEGKSGQFQVKILDFGLARPIDGDSNLTGSNLVLGTPAYMAPELADGLEVTARSDLFSLGCVLYQLATGTTPFKGPTRSAVLRAVAEHNPPPPHSVRPEVPKAFSELIMQLLSKEAGKRPDSAQMVAEKLRSLEAAGPTPTSAVSPALPAFAGVAQERRLVVSATGAWEKPRSKAAWSCSLTLTVGVLAVGLFLVFQSAYEHTPPDSFPFPPNKILPSPDGLPSKAAYQGRVDILVWSKAGGQARKLRLTDPGALPLAPGDQIRVTASIQPAAYLYLFWIDEEGMAVPVYPWEPGKWGTRPQKEEMVDALDLPGELTKGFTITPGREGMETLIMLALDKPMTADDEDLQRRLGGLPPQRPVQDVLASVWFENGKVVEHDPTRVRANFELTEINDPVLRLQDCLRLQLQPLARDSTAVSFARQGKK